MSASFKTLEDTLYVGNLAFSTTEAAVRDHFTAEGRTVRQVTLVTNYKSGRSRGFGFVRLGSVDEADAALGLDGSELDGRAISVGKGREKALRRVR